MPEKKGRRRQIEGESRFVNFRISQNDWEICDFISTQQHRTVSSFLRVLISEYIDRLKLSDVWDVVQRGLGEKDNAN